MKKNKKSMEEKLLDVGENYYTVYAPVGIAAGLLTISYVLDLIINNDFVSKLLIGLSVIVFSMSGLLQMKYKEVPGSIRIRGAIAVVIGLIWFLFFFSLGLFMLVTELTQ